MKNRGKFIKISDIITILILIACVYFAYKFYESRNFNNFVMSERNLRSSNFSRDNEEKYLNKASYKITSENYNDAMFYETIKVKKDTPYKVTCMVKSKNVESENKLLGSGAQISVEDTTERSVAVSGSSDWQEIEMIFNSKNREEVNIGFRLGGYIDNCKGEAWFSDFKIEEGLSKDNSTNWKFACFIFDTVNAEVKGEKFNYALTGQEIQDMRSTIKRFESAAGEMSKGKMSATCDIYKADSPITSLSYDNQYGYFVSPEDVEAQIKSTINSNDYDHIFIIFKLGDKEAKDWVGLGSMDYYGVGYSNIRLPNQSNNYIYKYNPRINQFPEEVLMHEFLHSLERTLNEYGYERPELHDNEKYGYKVKALFGLKDWYADYMNCNISANQGRIGLDKIVYTLKPAKESNFKTSQEVQDAFSVPENIFEGIAQFFKKVGTNIRMIAQGVQEGN